MSYLRMVFNIRNPRFAAAAALSTAFVAASPTVWLEREAYLMGTGLRAVVSAPTRSAAIAATEIAFGEVERLERVLSSWRTDSDLSALNQAAPGAAVRPTPALFQLLREVQPWIAETGGAFDPAVGPLIDVWDLRGEGRVPGSDEVEKAVALSGDGAFCLNLEEKRVVRSHARAWMTAGAFGKGAALRAARRALVEAGVGSALLDFGGQLVAIGRPEGGGDWEVGVAHPSHRDQVAAHLVLNGRSAATSAASERFVEVDGQRYGHIVDPRTGWPVVAWGSVTVVHEDPLIADLLSTALFVMGPDEGMEWLDSHPDLAVLFLELSGDGLKASWTSAMDEWLAD